MEWLENLLLREYLRVSQDRSGEGKSPDQQHDENIEAVDRVGRGWRLHPQPYRDTNRSASRYARRVREDFEQLLIDLEDDRFGADALALWESSRGSRQVEEWAKLVRLCEERGVYVWVTTHGRMYDPANPRDRRTLLEDAVDAEYESAKISERIRRDTKSAAQKGRPHGKHIYGYKRIYDSETRKLIEIVEHPDQAWVVKEAGMRVLAGESFYAIAADFNGRGIPPRRAAYKAHNEGRGWTNVAIKQMLQMPAYAAKRQHHPLRGEPGLYDAAWPALIKPDLWVKLQQVMESRSDQDSNDWPATHMLSGIALCGVCGARTRIGKQNAGGWRPFDETRDTNEDGELVWRHKIVDGGDLLVREHYYTYECAGILGKQGFHVSMREEHLDFVVRKVLLDRLEDPDFLARVGGREDEINNERKALLNEIRGHDEWLEKVHEEAEERRDMRFLRRQEDRVRPKIEAAQARLRALAPVDPVVLELVASGRPREIWAEHENPDGLVWRRQVIRSVMSPRILRVRPEHRGMRGINWARVVPGWR